MRCSRKLWRDCDYEKWPLTKRRVVFILVISLMSAVIYRMTFNELVSEILRETHMMSRHVNVLVDDKYSLYLNMPEVTSIDQVADVQRSSFFIENSNLIYSVGDIVTVRILLKDGAGNHMKTGGDWLRIWLTEPRLGASVNGLVTDHGDGTYTGTVQTLWEGTPQLKISIANTKEHVGAIADYIQDRGLMFPIYAKYKRGQYTSKTLCSPNVASLMPRKLCNYTVENRGFPWFCEQPVTNLLRCEDWTSVTHSLTFHGQSDAVVDLVRKHKHMLLPNVPTITVVGENRLTDNSLKLCTSYPAENTWFDSTPIGYYFGSTWRSLTCTSRSIDTLTSYLDAYRRCLSNYTIVFLGDSNIRSWFFRMKTLLDMHITTYDYPSHGKNIRWHQQLNAESKDLNTSLLWCPHEFPFYTIGQIPSKLKIHSVAHNLETLNNVRRHLLVVIHLYYHFARTTPAVFRDHVIDAKNGVVRLLKKYPDAKVFIKGPHAITNAAVLEPLDFLRVYHQKMFLEVFKEMRKNVYFLDEWDITVCAENVNIHPVQTVVEDMVDHCLDFICK